MPNQFFSPEGDLEDYFVSEYWLIDQYIGDQLWIWGDAAYDAGLGIGIINSIRLTPVTTTAGGTNWKQVSLGYEHSAGIKTDGTLWIWGSSNSGHLGNGSTTLRSTPVTTFAGGDNWKQVSLSKDATHAIKTDGTLWQWGYAGALGINVSFGTISTPVTTFAGGNDWKIVSAGNFHVAAIKTDGRLYLWGGNYEGLLGHAIINDALTPITTFAGGNDWKEVAPGRYHTAAIKTDGTLWTWGFNGFNPDGQLGINDTAGLSRSTPVTTFVGGNNWKSVASGANHVAAVKSNGTLWTWGNNVYGQLGNGPLRRRPTPITTFAGGSNWDSGVKSEDLYTISAGRDHTLAIKTDGTLWIWGNGAVGALGNAVTTFRSTPITTFAGGTNWKQVSSGRCSFGSNTAAIKTDGTLWAWGNGFYGQTGNATTITINSTPITTFAGGTNWKQVSTGGYHTAAIKTDGTLWTWGYAYRGRLGNATIINRSTPVTTFSGGTNWKQVSSGKGHTSAIKTDGTLWSWGLGNSGELGNASILATNSTPVTTFAGGTNWKQVSCAGGNSAAIKTDGTLWVWGSNYQGQLGNANTTRSSTPITTFTGGTNWKQVSVGDGHTSAIKTDGTLWLWGIGSNGELGNAQTTTINSTPVTTFVGGTNWTQVSSGRDYTIALNFNGNVFIWGSGGSGRLGNANTTNTSTPVTTFAGGTNWADTIVNPEYLYTITSTSQGGAAVKIDGTLWLWGSGIKLGNASTVGFPYVYTPITTFAGGTNWRQVSQGGDTTLAIKTDGTLWAWGQGNNGKLGNASTLGTTTPITTFTGGTNWKQISVSNSISAIKTDGTLWTWGYGNYGRLGNASIGSVSTPITTFAGGTNWKQVSSTQGHTAAVKTDGTLWLWGTTSNGRLGNGITTASGVVSTPITTFSGGTNWKQVSVSYATSAAIKTDGTLWTWGYGGRGSLGNGTTINTSTPVTTFAGGTNWIQISVGQASSAAIKTDGTLWTWGYGGYGELANNDNYYDRVNEIVSTPVTTFTGGTNWKQVYAQVAVKSNGQLYVWGSNFDDYELGSGIPQNFVPVEVDGNATNWKQADGGYGNTAAIKTDGTLWTWGYNTSGELGNNADTAFSTRVYTPITTTAGGTNWKQVSHGRLHVAAVQSGIDANYPLS